MILSFIHISPCTQYIFILTYVYYSTHIHVYIHVYIGPIRDPAISLATYTRYHDLKSQNKPIYFQINNTTECILNSTMLYVEKIIQIRDSVEIIDGTKS